MICLPSFWQDSFSIKSDLFRLNQKIDFTIVVSLKIELLAANGPVTVQRKAFPALNELENIVQSSTKYANIYLMSPL